MKKIFVTLAVLFGLLCNLSAKQPKYFFYIIGDGMGVNFVSMTQYYKAAAAGKHGTLPLSFSSFPVASFATTWCLDKEVTDSPASGSALATGQKVNYRAVSQDPSGAPIRTVAEMAKDAGRKVALLTTSAANDATPAAFCAHRINRNCYDDIIGDMIKADFDFYSGSKLSRSKKEYNPNKTLDPIKAFKKAGYKFVGSREEFLSTYKKADKILMLPDDKHAVTFAIDRNIEKKSPLTLSDMLNSCIEFFMMDGCPQGFFMMVESGKIDYAGHGNDAAAAITETLDLDKSVQIAIDFYNAHPDETAILLVSDHDTGASTIRPKSKEALLTLSHQKASGDRITKILSERVKELKGKMTWEELKMFLSEYLGFWSGFQVKDADEAALRAIYERTIARANISGVTDEYGYNHTAEIIVKALQISNSYAGIQWNTTSHSGSFVPVYYIGPRPELFSGMNDNALLGQKVKELLVK